MSNFITTEDCLEILKKYQPKTKKHLLNFEIGKLGDKTLGFLGDHSRLTLHYETEGNPGTHRASFFVKCIPQANANANVYVTEMGIFPKEIMLYKYLLPDLQRLVSVKFCPESYLTNYEERYFVLENLAEEGYAVSSSETLGDGEIQAMLETLAAFHASSLIYEERKSGKGKRYRLSDDFEEALKEGTFSDVEGHPRNKWGKATMKAVADCAALLPQFANNGKVKEKIFRLVKQHIDEYIKPSKVFRNVMTHDDLWKNNLMFRKAETGNFECVFVDFQLTRYSPPALDVLMALYLTVSSTKLQKSLQTLLETYYKLLAHQLETNSVTPDLVLPKEEFFRSVEIYRLPALLEAVMYGTNVFLGQQISDLIVSDENVFKEYVYSNRSKYVCQEFKENDSFRRRFGEVLVPFVEGLMGQ